MPEQSKNQIVDWATYELHCKGEFRVIRHGQAELSKEVKEIRKLITGNGEEGLKGIISRHDIHISRLNKWMAGFTGAGMIVITGLILWFVKTLMEHLSEIK